MPWRFILLAFSACVFVASFVIIFQGLKRPRGRFSFHQMFVKEPPDSDKNGAQLIGDGIFGIVCALTMVFAAFYWY